VFADVFVGLFEHVGLERVHKFEEALLIYKLNRGGRKSQKTEENKNSLYYFGLPALLIVDLSEIEFNLDTLRFMALNLVPFFLVLGGVVLLSLTLGVDRRRLFLYIIVTSFGNLGFFGLAFIRFAFNSLEAERYAALSVASINTLGFILSLILLELASNTQTDDSLRGKVVSSLSTNPLILSIIVGVGFSLLGFKIPAPVSSGLHMIGGSVAPIAIFMLGVSIYGKEYSGLVEAGLISSIRLLVLPFVALLVSRWFGLSLLQTSIVVVMYGTPLALSMVILSERYGFMEKQVSSIIMVSSLLSGLTMNIWLYVIDALL
jgi:predicted permease